MLYSEYQLFAISTVEHVFLSGIVVDGFYDRSFNGAWNVDGCNFLFPDYWFLDKNVEKEWKIR